MSNEIDNIVVTVSSGIENINIDHSLIVDDINIDYLSEIDNIELNYGTGGFVDSVNGLIGHINLTASAILSVTSTSAGYYYHQFNHNLNYQFPIVNILDTNNQLVMSDLLFNSSTYVTIKSLIDLTGYKAVAQR